MTRLRMRIGISGALVLGIAIIAAALARPAMADADPVDLNWAQLVPPIAPLAKKKRLPFWLPPRRTTPVDPAAPAPQFEEKSWMSTPRRTVGAPAPVVTELDGKRVRIGGYIVPLDFDATMITEFLLVPFVGACVHVPPPPANQIVYVKSETGVEINGLFDPVYVTGKMAAKTAYTGIADAGYTISADKVEERKTTPSSRRRVRH